MASKKTRKSKSSHPIMDLLEVLGRRWVLRILWELRDGPLTFRALQSAASDVSPSKRRRRTGPPLPINHRSTVNGSDISGFDEARPFRFRRARQGLTPTSDSSSFRMRNTAWL